MKKFLAMIMVMAMVLSLAVSLAACGNNAPAPTYPIVPNVTQPIVNNPSQPVVNNPSQPVVDVPDVTVPSVSVPEDETCSIEGEWEGEADLAFMLNDMFADAFGEEIAEYVALSEFEVEFVLAFEDDEFEMSITKKSLDKALEGVADDWVDGFTRMIEDALAASGKDMTVEEAAQEAFGMSIEDYVEANVSEIDLSGFEGSGEYKLVGNKLYMDGNDEYFTIRLTDDEFEFLSYSNEIDMAPAMTLFEGVEFERQ